ncbi:molecular chaperone [Klebsiella sp. BIGb0407]|uniref:fimbrial biogenesis chaperone n=1 Tax=Klebsiella sp. BIGb0407 TaxID=2940603 RepID=UPI0021681973|nr:fimbria/pilus periplasmic chaperone [Klebsiella sp. BIGb0407]MCS3431106.1 P pilus assembly chaperone PapD [Klebsiella sp. BIGb0407]
MKNTNVILSTLLLLSSYAQASLTMDRTRVIYDAAKPGVSVVVENIDAKDPYLVQTWLESSDGKKITEPLVALPLLQRIEPNQKKQIRINSVNEITPLSKDKESLMYFNILGVPPKSNIENVVEVVIQSRFKLFYRPKGLQKYPDNNWQQELKVEKKNNQLYFSNPTPYHVVIININNKPQKVKDFSEVIIKPNGNFVYPLNDKQRSGNDFMVTYIDDYGAPKTLKYTCSGSSCSLLKEKPSSKG